MIIHPLLLGNGAGYFKIIFIKADEWMNAPTSFSNRLGMHLYDFKTG